MKAPRTPATFLEFQREFASEEACQAYLEQWRWPGGFRCPRCAHGAAWRLARRRMLQCAGCRYQVSVTAGTALHRSKLPLRMWFWAIFLVARHKKGISALQLQADLQIGSYETAWALLHKIRACFGEKPGFPLRGLVEVDESFVGGVQRGEPGRGRGTPNKEIVVAAVERRADGRLGSARFEVVEDGSSATLIPFIQRHVSPGARVETDAWSGYRAVRAAGYRHAVRRSLHADGSFRAVLPGVHLLFSNLKTWLRGCFHSIGLHYLPAYAAEFNYRYNRRHSPPQLFGWVTRRLMQRPPRTLAAIQAAASG